jgi:hypothetical protein
MLVINYDEWGGFFDHVAPPTLAPGNQYIDTVDVSRNAAGQITGVLSGFRVPCIIASPYTKGTPEDPRVAHSMFDHTSILAFIERNWGLTPMTPRDASVQNRASAHALSNLGVALKGSPDLTVPDLPLLSPYVFSGCEVPIAQQAPAVPSEEVPQPGTTYPPLSTRDSAWQTLKGSDLIRGWV